MVGVVLEELAVEVLSGEEETDFIGLSLLYPKSDELEKLWDDLTLRLEMRGNVGPGYILLVSDLIYKEQTWHTRMDTATVGGPLPLHLGLGRKLGVGY